MRNDKFRQLLDDVLTEPLNEHEVEAKWQALECL